jgi:predicted ArsR family transcriptional regulator|tara:strand:- start:6689 stop:6928 length:240 start_codon:yes stop_codon:yes gene_type:complete
MKECAKKCYLEHVSCKEKECRMWIDFEEDKNCTLVAVKKHGPMTLKEIAERHDISVVRAKQILDSTLDKIKNVVSLTSY